MIIGISGMKLDDRGRPNGTRGAGKDASAAVLIRRFGFKKIAFADPMKDFAREVFGFDEHQLNGPSEAREAIDPRWGISPRHALQTLGTEWGRKLCHPDVWVRHAMRRAAGIVERGEAPGVVLTDLRFPNEVACVRAAGGLVVRVRRPWTGPRRGWATYALARLRAFLGRDRAAAHASERALDGFADRDFDHVIENDGSLEDLERAVRRMMGEPVTGDSGIGYNPSHG